MNVPRVPLCEICGMKTAKFVCQKCGLLVCEDHFDQRTGLCVRCLEEAMGKGEGSPETGLSLRPSLPLLTIFLGFALVFLGFIMMLIGSFTLSELPVEGTIGGIAIIGPIPLVFGYGKHALPLLIVLAVLIAAIILLQILLLRRK